MTASNSPAPSENESKEVKPEPSEEKVSKEVPVTKEKSKTQVSTKESVPYGLEPLVHMQEIVVKQNLEILEIVLGCETSNSYDIQNKLGEKFYSATESSWFCFRNCCTCCCGSSRPLTIEIKDLLGEMVLKIQRPWRCQRYWCCCCQQKVSVELPDGTLLGKVSQTCSCCRPWFKVTNATGEAIFKIRGPVCQCNICCKDVEYTLIDVETNEEVGKVAKNWSGLLKEAFTDTDTFTITFPKKTNVRIKAVLMAAAFLIDYMFFESEGRNTHQTVPLPDATDLQ